MVVFERIGRDRDALLRVLTTNKPAMPFWRRVVRQYCGEDYSERSVFDSGREWVHLGFDNSRHR